VAKKLIFICGPNGVGKSSTGRELINYIENSAFVDSDLCALRNPFIDTEGICLGKQFMQYMLAKYMESSQYECIIWAYGFHVRIPAHPDGKTGNIRTPFRQHPDSKPALSGHLVE